MKRQDCKTARTPSFLPSVPNTEPRNSLGTWLREISSCSCLTFLRGPAWVLLSMICKDFFSALYNLVSAKNFENCPLQSGDFLSPFCPKRARDHQQHHGLWRKLLTLTPALARNRPLPCTFTRPRPGCVLSHSFFQSIMDAPRTDGRTPHPDSQGPGWGKSRSRASENGAVTQPRNRNS